MGKLVGLAGIKAESRSYSKGKVKREKGKGLEPAITFPFPLSPFAFPL